MSDDRVCKRCAHADCAMERGDPLPAPVTRAWRAGVEYLDRNALVVLAVLQEVKP